MTHAQIKKANFKISNKKIYCGVTGRRTSIFILQGKASNEVLSCHFSLRDLETEIRERTRSRQQTEIILEVK